VPKHAYIQALSLESQVLNSLNHFWSHSSDFVAALIDQGYCFPLPIAKSTAGLPAREASWRRALDPCAPLLFILHDYLEQNLHFEFVPEHAPGPIS